MLFCFVQALFYPSFVFLTLLNLKLYKNYLILFFVISLPGIVITVSGVSRLKTLVLVSFNSALNPILYCRRISEMRQAVYSNLFYTLYVYTCIITLYMPLPPNDRDSKETRPWLASCVPRAIKESQCHFIHILLIPTGSWHFGWLAWN